ncbi:MAG: isoprenylcysteine carboxylmethyltransferase family protein [Pyrinomonadaceae bacterium]
MKTLIHFVGDLLSFVAIVFIVLLGWGDTRTFFAHGARVGWVVVTICAVVQSLWTERSLNRGLRATGRQGRELILLETATFACYFLAAFGDRRGILTLPESDALRYAGLAIYFAGRALRAYALIHLGRYFSVFLTIQEDHRLVTNNIYRLMRHPSYTGLLLHSLGFAIIFRSSIALVAWFGLLIFLIRRMNREEAVLASEFGAAWQGYRARTAWRLWPGIY